MKIRFKAIGIRKLRIVMQKAVSHIKMLIKEIVNGSKRQIYL